MNRKDFMGRLEELLMDIPTEERVEAMAFYHSYFEDAGEENEERVIHELESPEKVAASIKADMNLETAAAEAEAVRTEAARVEAEVVGTKSARVEAEVVRAEGGRREAEGAQAEEYALVRQARTEEPRAERGSRTEYTQAEGDSWRENGDTGTRKTGKKEDDTIKIVLIVVVAVLTSPIWLSILGGLLGLILGAMGGILGIAVAIVAVAFSLYLAGIALCCVSMAAFGGGAAAIGFGLLGAGVLILVLAVLSTILCVWVFGSFVPWAVKGIAFGCKKLFRKREKGGYAA